MSRAQRAQRAIRNEQGRGASFQHKLSCKIARELQRFYDNNQVARFNNIKKIKKDIVITHVLFQFLVCPDRMRDPEGFQILPLGLCKFVQTSQELGPDPVEQLFELLARLVGAAERRLQEAA